MFWLGCYNQLKRKKIKDSFQKKEGQSHVNDVR